MRGGFAGGAHRFTTAAAIEPQQNVHAVIEGIDSNFSRYIDFSTGHPFREMHLSGFQRSLRRGRILVPVLGDDRDQVGRRAPLRATPSQMLRFDVRLFPASGMLGGKVMLTRFDPYIPGSCARSTQCIHVPAPGHVERIYSN
jgi:hypothetical protein